MKNKNILIIEDEIFIARGLKSYLESQSYMVKISYKLENILSILENERIDLIISDFMLDKKDDALDGIDICLKIQKKYKIPIIFITAHESKKLYESISKIKNYTGFLRKPIDLNSLSSLVQIAFSMKQDIQFLELNNKYTFDKNNKILFFKNRKIHLTKKQLELINLLIDNINEYVSYEIIETILWNDEIIESSTMRTFVSRFRKEFSGLTIKTKRNHGLGLILD